MSNIWAAQWRSENKIDGKTRHILYENCLPKLFNTRQKCRDWIQEKYGYIKTRTDLRQEPHGWRMPVAVKVNIKATRTEGTDE